MGGGLLLSALLLTGCPNPSVPDSDGSQENSTKETNYEDRTLENAKSALTIQTVVAKSGETITLPLAVSGCEGVEVSWISDNEVIINISSTGSEPHDIGYVTHQEGEGADTVRLTAILSYKGKTATKSFDVTVYQASAELSNDQILESAAEQISANATLLALELESSYEPGEVTLLSSVTVDGKSVSVSWEMPSENSHLVLSGYKLTVTRDIVDIPLSLVAHLSYDGATKDKTLPVTVTHIPRFVMTYASSFGRTETYSYIFDDPTLTVTYDVGYDVGDGGYEERQSGSKYSFTADTSARILTLTKTHVLENGAWYSKYEYKTYLKDGYNKWLAETKKTYANPTVKNLLDVMKAMDPDWTEEDVCIMLLENGYFPTDVSEENVMSQPESVKNAAVQEYMDDQVDYCRDKLEMPASATVEQVLDEYFQKMYFSPVDDNIEREFSTVPYDYAIEHVGSFDDETWDNSMKFTATSRWTPGKHWHEQVANYWTTSDESASLYSYYQSDGENRGYFSYFNYSSEFSIRGNAYFNSSFTAFTLEPNSGDSAVIADEDKNWTVTEDFASNKITVSNGHGKTLDLYYRGESLRY